MLNAIKIIFFLFTVAANAATVAVLEIVISDDDIEMTIEETQFLTDELRKQARLALPQDTYSILTRDNILRLIPENDEEAEALLQSGAVEIGRAIKSDYTASSSLSKLRNLFTLKIRLYETKSGILIGELVKVSPDFTGLLEIIQEKAQDLFLKITKKDKIDEKRDIIVEKKIDAESSIPTNISSEKKSGTLFWVAVGLDALSVAAVGYGISQNSKGNDFYNKYQDKNLRRVEQQAAYDNAQKAKSTRNISYIAGGVLLASGITIHILF
jgi:hypothetical protein